jgi:hypothetical protein
MVSIQIKRCCLRGPCLGVIRNTTGATVQESVKERCSWKGEDMSSEAEKSPLLEAVTRDTVGWENLACAVVICKVWRLAMML